MKINLQEFIEKARSLGIDVKENSNTPGVFTEINGEKVKLNFEDIFPEVSVLEEKSDVILPLNVVANFSDLAKVEVRSDKNFKNVNTFIGAA